MSVHIMTVEIVHCDLQDELILLIRLSAVSFGAPIQLSYRSWLRHRWGTPPVQRNGCPVGVMGQPEVAPAI